MHKPDYKCDVIEGVRICIDRNSGNAFKQANAYYTILSEHVPFQLDYANKCYRQGIACYSLNLRNAAMYISIFLLAALLINFLHELVHFMVFYVSGENVTSFSFTFNGGITNVTFPPVESHSILWWYAAIMGPLLFVNFTLIVCVYLYYANTPVMSNYRNITINATKFKEIFIKSVGYLSCIIIIMNTIFSPLFDIFYDALGVKNKSDFMTAWNLSLRMSQNTYNNSEYIILAVIPFFLLSLVMMIKGKEDIKNLGIVLVILFGSVLLVFPFGITDRLFFQWICIISVAIENVFAFIYFFTFGKRAV